MCVNYAWAWDDYEACRTVFHPYCYRLMPSRWPTVLEVTNTYKTRGLTARPHDATIRRFVCEVCTVRAQIGEDISRDTKHYLELERARLITTWNAQADGGIRSLAGQRRVLLALDAALPDNCPRSLEGKFMPYWPNPTRLRTLAWHLLSLSRHGGQGENGARAMSSVKKFRAVYFNELRDLRIDDEALIAFEKRHVYAPNSIPTESIGFSQFFLGMRIRHGEQTQQAWPLPRSVALALESEFQRLASSAKSPWARYLTALARLAHDIYFTFILRGDEPFMIRHAAVRDNLFLESPCPFCGKLHVAFYLQERTKKNMTGQQFDLLSVPVTGVGLRIGDAVKQVLRAREQVRVRSPLLFVKEDGSRWDGNFFRKTYLEPALRKLAAQGHWGMKNAPWEKGGQAMNIRMYRRGGTTFYQTTPIGEDLLDLMGRWKPEVRNRMSGTMRQRYSGFSCKHMVFITSAEASGVFA